MAIELEDGTIVRSLPEQVDYLTTHNEENEIAIDNLAARLEAAIAGVLHYKGSVATYADLPADAEVGDVYNVIDTGANYAWTGEEWDELGSSIDISSLVDLTSAQTITGIKTFSTKIQLGDSSNSIGVNSNELELKSGIQIRVYNNIRPASGGNYSLGSRTLPFKEISLSHAINPNASNYGLTFPNTSGFAADKELGLAEGTFNVINANDIVSSTLTQAQFDLITNGKQTRIEGVLLGIKNPIISPLWTAGGSTRYLGTIEGMENVNRVYIRRLVGVDISTRIIGLRYQNKLGVDFNDVSEVLVLNKKAFPAYPADNTKPYKFVQKVGGLLEFVEDLTDTEISDLRNLITYAKAQGWIS